VLIRTIDGDDMAIEDALVVLIDRWDDVMARMDAESRASLVRLLAALDRPGPPDASSGIADLLVETLPPDHLVRRALADGYLFAPATLDWPALACHLRGLLATHGSGSADPPDATVPQGIAGRPPREGGN
jgi:hypothetical protein